MSLQFSGWEVVEDGSSVPVVLADLQKPQNRGVYMMFHGTTVNNAKSIIANGFQQSSSGLLGQGVYVSRNKSKAAIYPKNIKPSDRVILKLKVRVGRVIRIDKDNHPLQYSWHAHGYDTAWVPPNCNMKAVPSGFEENCVFEPKRVKVTGIEQAPNASVKELQQQLAKILKKEDNPDLCPLCKRKTQQGAPHISQQCWKCGKNICILMAKHFCP